ncbi:MAG: symmetrical bis(5'-nucleosyl)-tetraphosphatase [Ghiorsea sp.]|nr:symmetrical bis(5'-nucleosyl)-tetraphosphatase [Ghiorsea sp.]
MAVYVVGDIQGCYKPLKALLKQVKFNPKQDVLWCAGDMVNRGPDSLKVLRYLKILGDACVCVLGNHDIQLLAYYAGGKSFSGDTLDEVVKAKDADELITWLRHQPLLHHDKDLGWGMVHAGLSPLWSLKKAKKQARKVEKVLQSDGWGEFCKSLQTKDFSTQDPQDKTKRLLFSTAVLTRTRFCSDEGVFDWQQKTADAKDEHVKPWFEHGHAKWKKKTKVVFGHWAAKGLVQTEYVLGLDTGCVWGGSLTIAKLGKHKVDNIFSIANTSGLGID